MPNLMHRLKSLMSPRLKGNIAGVWRRLMFRTTVIAITGSMGKTTTKELLAMALATQGKTLKTDGNKNGEDGVPRTLRSIRPWHRFAVIEIGAGKRGVLYPRAKLVRPDIAVVLCVAATHQNEFLNLENTAEEKAGLLRALPPHGIAVLNKNDPRVVDMAALCPGKVIYYGTDTDADFVASNIRHGWPDRLSFDFKSATESLNVKTGLVGAHWVNSTSAALAVANTCGVPLSEAAPAIASVVAFPGRMQPLELPNGAIFLRDESHASVSAFESMFAELVCAQSTRKGLVIGDHTDSKKSPKKRFRALAKRAAEHCDFVVFVGDHSQHGHAAAVSAGMDPELCPAVFGVEHAAQWLKENLQKDDLVFIKGRSTDHLSRAVFAQAGEIGCWKTYCPLLQMCDSCEQLKPSPEVKKLLSPGNLHPNLIAGK